MNVAAKKALEEAAMIEDIAERMAAVRAWVRDWIASPGIEWKIDDVLVEKAQTPQIFQAEVAARHMRKLIEQVCLDGGREGVLFLESFKNSIERNTKFLLELTLVRYRPRKQP